MWGENPQPGSGLACSAPGSAALTRTMLAGSRGDVGFGPPGSSQGSSSSPLPGISANNPVAGKTQICHLIQRVSEFLEKLCCCQETPDQALSLPWGRLGSVSWLSVPWAHVCRGLAPSEPFVVGRDGWVCCACVIYHIVTQPCSGEACCQGERLLPQGLFDHAELKHRLFVRLGLWFVF